MTEEMVGQKVKSLRKSRQHIRARMYSSELSGEIHAPAANIGGSGIFIQQKTQWAPKPLWRRQKSLAQAGNLTKNPVQSNPQHCHYID